MRSTIFHAGLIVCLFVFGVFSAENKESKRVQSSINVFKAIQDIPDKTIPIGILEKAEGIAIIPNVIKGAIGIGGRWGKGVMMVRTEKGWSDPSFISFGGASIGWQWGGEATDFVLIFRTRQSIEGVTSGKFTIGPNASAAAGPVGRSAEASTDAQLKAAILTYARSRGLFAGVSLEGSSLSIDDDANIEYYGTKRISARAIFDGEITNKPPSAAKLVEAVTNATTGKGTKPGG